MGTRRNPGRFDCYLNAKEDEPMFILLARDPIAPLIIELWCFYRSLLVWSKIKPKTDLEMVAEARMCAEEMTKWRKGNWGPQIPHIPCDECSSATFDCTGKCRV